VISGFGREVDEHCALLGCYAASSGDFLTTSRDNLSSAPSFRVRESKKENRRWDPRGYPETSVRNYRYSLRNAQNSAVIRYIIVSKKYA